MLTITPTDFTRPAHRAAFLHLLDHYAHDPMGGGVGLSEFAKAHLVDGLAARVNFASRLAFDGDSAVGLINCFEGYSTFAARPLLNIHDIVVHADWRGRGVGRALLAAAEALARERGCCKLTLEVLEGNRVARAAYQACGFGGYELTPETGQALFLEKKL
jgi:GNAT superfamily N-acetyltransferase